MLVVPNLPTLCLGKVGQVGPQSPQPNPLPFRGGVGGNGLGKEIKVGYYPIFPLNKEVPMSPHLEDVCAVVISAGAATEAHILTLLYRNFGMSADRARTALRLVAEAGRIERRVAANGFTTYRRPTARTAA